MDRGDLVPNEVVVDMVKNRLAQPDVAQHGWLLDGYPRSLEQAEAIEAVGIRPDIFLLIDVPDELLVERVVGRRLDPETGEIYHLQFKPPPADIVDRLTQRSDDTEDKVRWLLVFFAVCAHRCEQRLQLVSAYNRSAIASTPTTTTWTALWACMTRCWCDWTARARWMRCFRVLTRHSRV